MSGKYAPGDPEPLNLRRLVAPPGWAGPLRLPSAVKTSECK